MDVLVLIGRILFALLFLLNAVNHLTNTKALAGYTTSRGVPRALAPAAVVGTGLLLLAGAVSVGLGIWADLGALLLAVFLFPTALLMHRFWAETEPMTRLNEQAHFFKDIALGGAALMLLAFFSYVGDELGLTITGPLFHLS
ncbi:DoxX family membrane protein [Streptomyces ficellus]|uniref:DoxX family membrane protein n=1 Tax=Streptomyces ficellus TaxID=1977088 RepID=A0ABT7ZDY1_9ACTN|nr:DoxX family membrane protein [Streptomyces ficellus]MDN3297723.1 DoxX family membrane protein [Streptomyces ficellus]